MTLIEWIINTTTLPPVRCKSVSKPSEAASKRTANLPRKDYSSICDQEPFRRGKSSAKPLFIMKSIRLLTIVIGGGD